ncbi:hypothetical protein KUV85_07035 [Nocardioides panacisoli]|uniref:proton-conducting transporter transmembrane domain-containing protein n=1 Tax=Nocardioides panacisoli TaxID=627624 RepID=UPI001C6320E5|nr:proton-conducting transporter membrane subunit [Nocardioides panacisoli]QYJ05428.1 hypothetical protein KUV85_07035 [Nocardioides panacisoli]
MSAPMIMLAVLLPAVAGSALAGLGHVIPARVATVAGWLATLVLALSTAFGIAATATGAAVQASFVLGSDLGLAADGIGGLLLPAILGVAALVQLAATGAGETREPRFAGLMLLFAAAAALTVLATTLPTLLLGWEVMGATSYALIGYRYDEPRPVASGATALLTTRATDLGLYLAVAAAVAGGGANGLSLDGLAGLESEWRHLAAAGILVAACGKAAQLPFSWWLSRAMDGPSPVSALLHSAAMVALGAYLLLRVAPLLTATGWADDAAAWVGGLTAVVLGAVALTQTDLKQLLAASTAAQLGFVVLAAGVGATSAGTAHLVGHAAVKALLFLVAGAWLEALGSKRLDHLTGVARRWPVVGALAAVALLSLAGIPPLTLWATKDVVLAAALESSTALYVVGVVATVLATAYAAVALVTVLRTASEGAPHGELEQPPTGRVPVVVPVALAPLALGAVTLGVLALPAVVTSLPGAESPEPHLWELALSGAAAVVTAVLISTRMLRRSRTPSRRAASPLYRWLHGWLGLEPAARAILVRPTVAVAAAAGRFDDRVVAVIVDRLAGLVLQAGRATAAGDTLITRIVDGVAAVSRRAGGGVRRSGRSGQLHHYYLQLVGGVLLVAVVVSIALVTSPR